MSSHCSIGKMWPVVGIGLYLLTGTFWIDRSAEADQSCATSECHADLTGHEFKHAPAEAGLCTFCHNTHESEHPTQLKFPLEALCVSCHDKIVPEGARVVHGPVEKGQCTACHDSHSSNIKNQLVAEVPQLCFGCHDQDQTDHEGKTLPAVEQTFIDKSLIQHPPFARGDCLLCHDPHASDNIRLQRRPYSQAFYSDFSSDRYFCLMCHGDSTFAEPRTLTATKFRNGNLNLHYRHVNREKGRGCRACHHQHASSREAQIATDTFFGEQNIGIKAFAKSETGGTCEPSCHRAVRYDRLEAVNNAFLVTPREGTDATATELRQASNKHDGETLFLQRCAGCHGVDAGGKIGPPIKGATIDRVIAATDRVDLMRDLASLDEADLQAIVDALPAGAPVVALPPDASEGTVLFAANCAGCHGANANGNIGPAIRGASSVDIAAAINQVAMMVAMKSLSDESIGEIGEYLSQLDVSAGTIESRAAETGGDGQVIYSMNCLGCHGPSAQGQIGPSIRGKSDSDVHEAIGRVPMMAGLKTLATGDIEAVGHYLSGLATAEIDGQSFYVATCSACHGEDAGGHIGPDIRGLTAADIHSAIARVPMMVGMKSSTDIQIEAVGQYIRGLTVLNEQTAMENQPLGEALFNQNCAGCHGQDATGLVGPDITLASMDDITGAIDRVPMMIAMKMLGASEIKAAADYLAARRKQKQTSDDE